MFRFVSSLIAIFLAATAALGQEQPPQKAPSPAAAAPGDFDKQSLAIRTALHYDASLDAPLKSLIALYQNANRLEELIGLYRGHIAQYPADAGAKAVLIRILRALNRGEADESVQAAVQQHPDHALLHFLQFETRARRQDARALESLARAIDLEARPSLRDAWADRLLKDSAEGGLGHDLAKAHLEKLRGAEGHTAETLLALADKMHRHGFYELAMGSLTGAAELKPAPEVAVEIEFLSAKAQSALGDRAGAGARLEVLAAKLAADHWRRPEIVSLRVALLSTAADRAALAEAARKAHEANPASEGLALEYADVLAASERPREALAALLAVVEVFPQSERVEQRVLALLDRLGDAQSAADFLAARLEKFPERADLRFRLVKALHALNRGAEAAPQLDQVLKTLPAAESERHLVDLARHLRATDRAAESAALFQRALEAHPERFDLRRELAETHLARQDAAAARAVLRNLPVGEAAIENFLDLVEFMVASEFLGEARAALKARLAVAGAEGNLDLNLPLATVLAKSGERESAVAQVEKSRALADTPARYRAWLETGLGVREIFGDLDRFFDEEQQRLLAKTPGGKDAPWTPDRAERFLTFCELGEEKRLENRVNQAVRAQLDDADLPAELRLRLRRLLVRALERTPERAAEAEEHLRLLAKEDAGRASEYDLRRALMYHALQRPDLAREALESVQIEQVTELPILRVAHPVFVEYGMPTAARHCLEKMTENDPADLLTWQRRLSLLAGLGDEEGLRAAIRSLLASGDKVALGAGSIEALRRHVVDSLWRSISRRLGAGTASGAAEALALIEATHREAPGGGDRLWSLWAKALALHTAGQTAGRDATIVEFAALAKLTAERSGGQAEALSITFPDGLTLPLDAALAQLTAEAFGENKPAAVAEDPSEGPLAAPDLAWVFEADPGVRILQIEALAGGVAILDDAGTLYRVDRATGKLLWKEIFVAPPAEPEEAAEGVASAAQYHWVNPNPGARRPAVISAPSAPSGLNGTEPPALDLTSVKLPRRFVADAEGRVFIPVGRGIEAREFASGALLWAADLGEPGEPYPNEALAGLARPETRLHLDSGRLLAFVPENSVAAAIDPATGKLIWERKLDGKAADGPLHSLNSGSDARDGRFFVYGRQAAILDAETGKTVWRFDSGTARRFPVEIKDAAQTRDDTAATTPLALQTAGFLDHQAPANGRAEAVKTFLERPSALLAPAVHWSASRLAAAGASHAGIAPGGRLLLFGQRGFRSISLPLPLASLPVPLEGEFLGTAGTGAWLFGGSGLHRVDLRTGNARHIPIEAGFGTHARAVLSGGRLYVIGDQGVRLHHAHDGSRIGSWTWPAALTEYLARNPVASASANGKTVRLWQGSVETNASGQVFCLPVRDRVSDRTLFVLQGDRVVSAFTEKP